MDSLYTIAWLVVLLASIYLIFAFVGFRTMCNFFPEGKRAWHLPVQLATLAFFAAVVLHHPFS